MKLPSIRRRKQETKKDTQIAQAAAGAPSQEELDKKAKDDQAKANAVQNQPDAVKNPETGELETPAQRSGASKPKDDKKTTKQIKCATCKGTGLDPNNFKNYCPDCNGSGKVGIQVKKKGSDNGKSTNK